MQIVNTKPRSLCAAVQVSPEVPKYWYMAAVIFKIDLLWASLEKTIVMHLVNSNVFYILFATDKSISGCVFSRIKRIGIRAYCGAYFQVRFLAHIDHTFVSIASLFVAIKFMFLKSKSYALKRFSLNYID